MSTRSFGLNIPDLGAEGGDFIDVTSPYSGKVVGSVQRVSPKGMGHALEVAGQAFRDRSAWLPGFKRAGILSSMADLVKDNSDELSILIADEGGKPLSDARVEIARAENGIRLCAEEATRIRGKQIPMEGSAAAIGRIAYTIGEPIGVVAAVSAFNHPFNLIVHQVGTAVAAGCPVLIKPSLDTPLSCVRFVQLLCEAGLPPEWAMAVPSDRSVAEELVTSDRIAFFSFIGSADVGWYLRSKLSQGVRCALEHGGVAPVVIDESADLEDAVPLLVKGGYYHAGQVCVSVQRIFVHRSISAELIDRLTDEVSKLVVGDPRSPDTDVGPLIREAEVERVHSWVRESVERGAQLISGGEPMENQCYRPTLLLNPPLDSPVMTGEIFGPVVCIREVDSLDEGIGLANSVRWSFQAAVFTNDIDRAMSAAMRLNGAAVMINDHTAFRVDWMPFAGRGPSGLSVGGIGPAIRDMTEEKLIVIRVRSGAP